MTSKKNIFSDVEKLISMRPLFWFSQVLIVNFLQHHQYWVPDTCFHLKLRTLETISYWFIFLYLQFLPFNSFIWKNALFFQLMFILSLVNKSRLLPGSILVSACLYLKMCLSPYLMLHLLHVASSGSLYWPLSSRSNSCNFLLLQPLS